MISVIIVTFNAGKTLQKCLNSIYNQRNRQNIKLIIIDGKSSDDTVSILTNNKNDIDYWISEKDDGIYDAMNKGLKIINTPWVYFLGADDELLSDFSGMLDKLTNLKTVYYSNVIYKGAKQSGEVSSYHQAKLGIFHQSIIYPAQVFQKYKYDIRYKIAADYALNMKLHNDRLFNFKFLDYTIAKYDDNGISSTEVDFAFERDKLKLIFNNFKFYTFLRYIFREMKKNYNKVGSG